MSQSSASGTKSLDQQNRNDNNIITTIESTDSKELEAMQASIATLSFSKPYPPAFNCTSNAQSIHDIMDGGAEESTITLRWVNSLRPSSVEADSTKNEQYQGPFGFATKPLQRAPAFKSASDLHSKAIKPVELQIWGDFDKAMSLKARRSNSNGEGDKNPALYCEQTPSLASHQSETCSDLPSSTKDASLSDGSADISIVSEPRWNLSTPGYDSRNVTPPLTRARSCGPTRFEHIMLDYKPGRRRSVTAVIRVNARSASLESEKRMSVSDATSYKGPNKQDVPTAAATADKPRTGQVNATSSHSAALPEPNVWSLQPQVNRLVLSLAEADSTGIDGSSDTLTRPKRIPEKPQRAAKKSPTKSQYFSPPSPPPTAKKSYGIWSPPSLREHISLTSKTVHDRAIKTRANELLGGSRSPPVANDNSELAKDLGPLKTSERPARTTQIRSLLDLKSPQPARDHRGRFLKKMKPEDIAGNKMDVEATLEKLSGPDRHCVVARSFPLPLVIKQELRDESLDKSTRLAASSKAPDQSTETASCLSELNSQAIELDSLYEDSQHSEVPTDDLVVLLHKPRTRNKYPIRSSYFAEPHEIKLEEKKKRTRQAGRVSCIPFPPLDSDRFGLIQEELCYEPFWVIIATIFLTLTHGSKALPVFRIVKERWPLPEDLMHADHDELLDLIKSLGLIKRLKQYKETARAWVKSPPLPVQRHRVLHYPNRGDGKDIQLREILDDTDPRSGAWEIGHIVKGPYALDSWRIFCRDIFLGKADGWNGEGRDDDFEPEWMRVKPLDKELRAILRWMWLKEGYYWEAETGDKWIAGRELMVAAREGRIGWDSSTGDFRIVPWSEVESGDFVPRVGGECAVILRTWEELVEREADRRTMEDGSTCEVV